MPVRVKPKRLGFIICQVLGPHSLFGKCESFSLLPTTKLKKVNDKTIDFIYLSHNIRITCIKFVCLMVFNVTFNNILVISWQSILLETGGTREITASH